MSVKLKITDVVLPLQSELSKRIEQVTFCKGETEENWAKLRDEVDSAAWENIDVLKKHHQDWFDDNDTEIQGLLAEKYAAHKAWLADKQSDAKRDRFHSLRGKLQKQLRCMKHKWWKTKAEEF